LLRFRKFFPLLSSLLLLDMGWGASSAQTLDVMLTPTLGEFSVEHRGKQILIRRNQDTGAMLTFDFARTSRPCPPFCAQPMQVAEEVKTIGEVELFAFMQNELASGKGVLIDSRTPDWHRRGTIPGSINLPYTTLNPAQGADEITLEESLARLGVTPGLSGWDFSRAKILVLWCNGPWCGQSPSAIRGLLGIGYPSEKLRYYRGGMQLWRIMGLPVVSPEGETVDF
jgi:rhodanese-related sulfurtransferase